jgi:hypothetical protein
VPNIAVIHGTGTTWAQKYHPFSLHLNSVDVIDPVGGRGFGVPLESISINEVGANGSSTMAFILKDAKLALAIPSRARVQFTDHHANEVLFAGYLVGRRLTTWAGHRGYAMEMTCVDYNVLLDMTIMPALKVPAGMTDSSIIRSIIAHSIRHKTIHGAHGLLVQTVASMPAMDFTHLTMRAAIEAVQYNAGEDRHYYVDFLTRFHYFQGPIESGMGSAPYGISDAPSGSQRAAQGLTLEYDDTQMVNAVLIAGQTRAGTGWVKDEASIKQYGLLEAIFPALHSASAAQLAKVGKHYLARHKDPIVRGSFATTGSDEGWRVGQGVTITNAALGISGAQYPIKAIDTTFASGTGIRTRVIHFGELPASGRRRGHGGGAATIVRTLGPHRHHAPRPIAHHHHGSSAHPRNKQVN